MTDVPTGRALVATATRIVVKVGSSSLTTTAGGIDPERGKSREPRHRRATREVAVGAQATGAPTPFEKSVRQVTKALTPVRGLTHIALTNEALPTAGARRGSDRPWSDPTWPCRVIWRLRCLTG